MVDARERFVEAARAVGVDVVPTTHPDGTRTAEDAAAAIGCEVDQIVKSLVFMAVGADGHEEPVLALTSGGRRVDTARLAELLGVPTVRKADAHEVRTATGYAIGGTPPFGHADDIPTFLDPHLLDFEVVWAAAGTPRDVFPLSPTDLQQAGAGLVGDFTTGA